MYKPYTFRFNGKVFREGFEIYYEDGVIPSIYFTSEVQAERVVAMLNGAFVLGYMKGQIDQIENIS